MRGVVLVLVYVVGAFFACVKCEDSPGFELDVLIEQIDRLELNEIELHQELEQSKQLTSALQAQLESKSADLEQFQQKISELTETGVKSEEKHKSHNEMHIREMEHVQLNQKALENQLKQAEQQTLTLRVQLESQNEKLERLKQKMVELTESNVKSEEKHQSQNQKLLQDIEESKLHQKSLEQQLEQSKQQSSALQVQLQSKNTTLVQLQQNVSELTELSKKSEEHHRIGSEKLVKEIDQLKFNQTILEKQLQQSEQTTTALQTQLQNKNLALEKIQQQMSELTRASVTSVEKHQTQAESYEKLVVEMEKMKLRQKTLEHLLNLNPDMLSADFRWISGSAQQPFPSRATFAGKDVNVGDLYVGRVRYNGHDLVAKVRVHEKFVCYITYGGKEIELDRCEILTGSGFAWISVASDGVLPDSAFPCGRKLNGQLQYIGRVKHESPQGKYSLTPGTVDGSDGRLYVPFGTKTYSYAKYEVLVIT